MSDLNDLSRPILTDTEPNVLDTLRAHIVRAATWAGWSSTVNKVAGIMSAVTAAVSGGRSLRLYRRNDANTADEEVVSLPGVSVGGNAATASAAQAGSTLQTVLDAKAPLNSAALTGTPTAPTAATGTATTQLASTAFVARAVANLVNTSPASLDTLNELATALGNDPNFATSTATALGNRVVRASANRPGVTKLYRNDSDDAFNVQTNWTGTRWRLRGYSGDTFHAEAEVAYAEVAGSVTNAFPAGTRMPFAQASAPTGWTQDVSDTANNRMLRVVNTAGGGVAGTHSPIVNSVVPSHTHGFSTGSVSNDHAHYVSGGTSGSGTHSHGVLDSNQNAGYGGGFDTGNVTGGVYRETTQAGDHAHSWSAWTGGINSNHTHSGSTDNGSSQTNWQPRYIDLIICTKN